MEAGLEAVALFDRALALAPSDGAVLLGRAAAQLAAGRIEDAIAGLAGQLAQNPGWLLGHATICRLRWLAGERRDFTASFEAAVAAVPREIAIWREWAETLMHAGRYDAALAVVAGAAPPPDRTRLDALEAVAVAEKGETDAADALSRRGADRLTSPRRRATCATCCAPAAPPRRRRSRSPGSADPEADLVWPDVSTAWRLTGDPRWQWLEGDERLVGVYDIGDAMPVARRPRRDLAQPLKSLHQPLEQSVRGGTQTDGPLFARIEPEIRALRAAIVTAVERHIAQLPPPQAGHPSLEPEAGAGALRGLLVGAAGRRRLPFQPYPSRRLDQLGLLRGAAGDGPGP